MGTVYAKYMYLFSKKGIPMYIVQHTSIAHVRHVIFVSMSVFIQIKQVTSNSSSDGKKLQKINSCFSINGQQLYFSVVHCK